MSSSQSGSASGTPLSHRSKKAGSSLSTPKATELPFTAIQQDRQARGKDPMGDHESDSDFGDEIYKKHDWYGNESYEAVMRRRTAANVLHNPDLLMMRAQALGQSLPRARHELLTIMCGFGTDTPASASEVLISEADREKERLRTRELSKPDSRSASGSREKGKTKA